MSTVSSPEALSTRVGRGHRYFLLRRLHSLSGMFPVGVYLIEHLLGNATAIKGPEAYNAYVGFLHSIPFLQYWVEALLLGPLFFHAIFGIVIAREAKHNVEEYNYERNWAFAMQRVTGYIAFAFIIYHLWALRISSELMDHPERAYSIVHEHISQLWVIPIYLVGMLAITFHFSNGLWSFAITWGITPGRKAQRVWRIICLYLIFPALSIVGIRALFAFY